MWKLADSLAVLGDEVNAFAPHRNKASDGTIGDPSHASRTSSHNPDVNGRVCARDFTHDPAGGFDSYRFADWLADRIIEDEANNVPDGLHLRVAGIGSHNVETGSDRWFAKRAGVWSWRDQALHGATHANHVHVEVPHNDNGYLNRSPWGLNGPDGLNSEEPLKLDADDFAKIDTLIMKRLAEAFDNAFAMADKDGKVQKRGLIYRLAGMIRRDETKQVR